MTLFEELKNRVLVPGTPQRRLYDRLTWAIVKRVRREPPPVVVHAPMPPDPYRVWRDRHEAERVVPNPSWPRISVVTRGTQTVDPHHERVELGTDATGAYVMLLGLDDALAPDALWRYAERAAATDADVLYADEDRLDEHGERRDPIFKPDWAPELLTSMDYIGPTLVARRSLVEEVGGFELPRFELILRLVDRTKRIEHVPRVLVHVRAHVGTDEEARIALSNAAARRGWPADVTITSPGRFRTRYALAQTPRVAIIIPTRDKIDLLRVTIDSIEQRSTYASYEIIVVDNGSSEAASLAYLAELARTHTVITDPSPFNWSTLNNRAARASTAPMLLFLNNDVEVLAPDWLEAMIEHAQRPEVGAVGAKLLYPDGRIQHAGVIMGLGGAASHAFRTMIDDGNEYLGLSSIVRDYSAVTGACLMTRRDVFESVGGFDEAFGIAYNDVDFCLRLGQLGLHVVYTPYARLHHFESATRGPGHPPENEALLVSRWGDAIAHDPFYSPHLTRVTEDFALREPIAAS